MRKLDIFTHIMPPAYFSRLMSVAPHFADVGKRMRNVPMLVDLDLRFRVMDGFEDYQQILSLPTPPIEVMAAARTPWIWRLRANDGMAELVERHPDRFPGFVASLPLGDPDCRGGASSGRSRAWGARHSALLQLTAGRCRRRSSCRCSRRWRGTTCRSGSTPTAAPTSPTTRPRTLAVRDLVDLRLAVRNQRRHVAPRLCGVFDRFPG